MIWRLKFADKDGRTNQSPWHQCLYESESYIQSVSTFNELEIFLAKHLKRHNDKLIFSIHEKGKREKMIDLAIEISRQRWQDIWIPWHHCLYESENYIQSIWTFNEIEIFLAKHLKRHKDKLIFTIQEKGKREKMIDLAIEISRQRWQDKSIPMTSVFVWIRKLYSKHFNF